MGKDLKGKELGKGISQRKDGYYTARFRNRDGKDVQKYFKKLQDCRNWIAEARFQDEHGGIYAMQDMTVNAWAEYWLENIKKPNVKLQTYNGYREKTKFIYPSSYRPYAFRRGQSDPLPGYSEPYGSEKLELK